MLEENKKPTFCQWSGVVGGGRVDVTWPPSSVCSSRGVRERRATIVNASRVGPLGDSSRSKVQSRFGGLLTRRDKHSRPFCNTANTPSIAAYLRHSAPAKREHLPRSFLEAADEPVNEHARLYRVTDPGGMNGSALVERNEPKRHRRRVETVAQEGTKTEEREKSDRGNVLVGSW